MMMMKHQKSLFDFFKAKNVYADVVPATAASTVAGVVGGKEEQPSSMMGVPTVSTSPTITLGATSSSSSSSGRSSILDSGVAAPFPSMQEQQSQPMVTWDCGSGSGNKTIIMNAAKSKNSINALGCASISSRCKGKSQGVMHSSGVKRKREAIQTFLDFGQDSVNGVTTCGLCGMLFNPTVEEDVRVHKRHCTLSSRRKGERWLVENSDAWITSEQLVKRLDDMAQQQNRCGGAAKEHIRNSSGSGRDFCKRVQESADDEFFCYVFDCSKEGFSENPVMCCLIETMRFSDVRLCAAAYCLVVVVHRRAARVVCAVAGRSSTREQDPALVLVQKQGENGIKTCCSTRSCVTFCDVPYVWWQREAVLTSSEVQWWSTQTEAALKSTCEALRDFFRPAAHRGEGHQRRLHALINAGLLCALKTLGRHVTYGYALCPRTQFSYDSGSLRDNVLSRVDAVTMCSDANPLYTYTDNPVDEGAAGSDGELSVVSYGD